MEALNQIRHGAGEHGAHSQSRQIVAAFRDQRANAADLHADGAKVGEAAQRKRRNGERTRRESGLLRAQADVSDDFVERHARAQQVADGACIVPRDADQPGDGCEDKAKDLAEARGEPGQSAMDPGEQHIEQRDQRPETKSA